MKHITVGDVVGLPVEERIELIEDIWDSVAEVPDAVEIPDWHKKELDKRLEAYHRNPSAGSPWLEVKRRILGEV
jgi:putative addiction module component (TIGR02574 family)